MGKKLRKEAQALGMMKLPLTVLYARPRKIKMTFSKYIPDTRNAIRDYLQFQDPNTAEGKSGGGRNNSFYFLSQQLGIFVWIVDKAAGFAMPNPNNHVLQIQIWTENNALISGIAHAVNNLFDDGLLAHMEWRKFEKKYKVNSQDCIAEWEKWLAAPAGEIAAPAPAAPAPQAPAGGKKCPSCGSDNPPDAAFCSNCGAAI